VTAAVSSTGTTIVGTFNGGGGFYWMPTTGVMFNGGLITTDVGGDGRTIGTDSFSRGVRWLDRRQGAFPGERGGVGIASGNRDGSIAVGRQCRPAIGGNLADDQSAWIYTAGGGTKCLPSRCAVICCSIVLDGGWPRAYVTAANMNTPTRRSAGL
jgi:hypothetical protein